jgi:glycosyltransferase involved in cell wall biosynthesis
MVVASLAEALAHQHSVEIVHHIHGLARDRLAAASGLDLSRVSLRFVERDCESNPYHRNPFRRYQSASAWHASLSSPYDLFVATVHGIPPFCHARHGALIVLFPTETAPHLKSLPPEIRHKPRARQWAERRYQRFEWKKRMEGYQVATAISEFSRDWTRRRWDIDSTIIYPPVDNHFKHVPKKNLLLSVGRFALEGEGHPKRQREMLTAYRELQERLPGWEYHTVGPLRDTRAHREFFESLKSEAAQCRSVMVREALSRDELKSLFEHASIFWHAAGYGEDENTHPELAEHFGISTVEAMAAGCVPVVINKGGQSEIVRHGIEGFLWNTLEELKEHTLTLTSDDDLRARMSAAARERARHFSKESATARYLELLRPLLVDA